MGMGEPLANFDAVWAAVERLHTDVGISARRITISTVGVVPGMRRLAEQELPVTLAVSCTRPTTRSARRWSPSTVATRSARSSTRRGRRLRRGRRVTFEYACIEAVNDRPRHAVGLAAMLKGFDAPGGAHVNLIPLNPTAGFPGRASDAGTIATFARLLREHGVAATVRRNRGTDIDAACGQLRSRRTAARGDRGPGE